MDWVALNSRNSFSNSLGCSNSKVKVLVRLVSSEDSHFGLQVAAFLLCFHVITLMCTPPPLLFVCPDKDTSY